MIWNKKFNFLVLFTIYGIYILCLKRGNRKERRKSNGNDIFEGDEFTIDEF